MKCGKSFIRENMTELRTCGEYDEHFKDIAYCDYCRGFNDANCEVSD